MKTRTAIKPDRVAPRPMNAQGGRPPYPTETMVRILVLKRPYNLSEEQMGDRGLVDRRTCTPRVPANRLSPEEQEAILGLSWISGEK